MSKNKINYYSLNYIDKTNEAYHIVIGRRNNGKTYGESMKTYDNLLEYEKKMIKSRLKNEEYTGGIKMSRKDLMEAINEFCTEIAECAEEQFEEQAENYEELYKELYKDYIILKNEYERLKTKYDAREKCVEIFEELWNAQNKN